MDMRSFSFSLHFYSVSGCSIALACAFAVATVAVSPIPIVTPTRRHTVCEKCRRLSIFNIPAIVQFNAEKDTTHNTRQHSKQLEAIEEYSSTKL